ncbi:MAG: hypothetical protein ABIJ26_02130 [Candidatus Margulisiibacteriota bacterium]
MWFKNREQKKHYKKVIEDIKRNIWNKEINIATALKGKEAYRRELDQLGGILKGQEEELEKLFGELEIPVKYDNEDKKEVSSIEELQKVRVATPPEEMLGLNDETKKGVIEVDAQNTRQERFDWLMEKKKRDIEMKHGQERTDYEKKVKETAQKIVGILDARGGLETDRTHTYEKMVGKWNEKEGRRLGGVDQVIEELARDQAGHRELIEVIKEELKKL